MTPTLHIRLLGGFLIVLGETPITTITISRLQSLLAYLLLHRDTAQDRSHIAFLLWPDSTEAQAHTNLRKLLYQLRQAFPDIDHFLQVDKQRLHWLPSSVEVPWTLDVLEFKEALTRATHAEQAQDMVVQRQALEQAMTLYRSDLLPGCYDEWILPERDLWHQLFLQAAQRFITVLEQERDYAAAITIAQQFLRQDPLHEATYRQLMRLHALCGERAAALRVYHTGVTLLERELGTEPSAATRTVYEMILQSNSLEASTGPLTIRDTTAPLIGRKAEWQQFQQAWRKSISGRPQIVLLVGEAGIGKTRLAEEMEVWVSRQGMATASARCYAPEGHLAYAPVTSWLRATALQTGLSNLDPSWLTEVARLVPEVLTTRPKLSRPTAITESWQRQHFFEALVRAILSAHQPLLLLLDDLQWCDNETLQWLHYLLRFDTSARLLLVATTRSEEIAPEHPLVAFLSALQREGFITEITLRPLDTTETISLAEHILQRPPDPAMIDILYQETEGNPLFIVEMVRAGTLLQGERGQQANSNGFSLLAQSRSTLPATVQSVLSTRLAQLSPLAHEIADVSAVIGREFTFTVLAQAYGKEENLVVRGLDELWQRRIIREQGEGSSEAYDFSHDKLREQAYTSLPPAQRRLLHRRVAESLVAVYGEDLDAVSGEVAAHYEHAGLPGQAIPYYQRAGAVAGRIYANTEAIRLLKHAVALLEAHASGQTRRIVPWETSVKVYEALGDITFEIGHYEEARQAYQRAIPYLPGSEAIRHAHLLRQVAKAWNYTSTNPHDTVHTHAREAFQEAEQILTQVADPASPVWREEWIGLQAAQIWPLRGSVDEIMTAIEKVQPIIEQYGTQEQRKLLLEAVGMYNAIRSRYVISEQLVISRRAALAEAKRTGDKGQIATAHMALGITLLWASHLDEAEEQLRQALHMGEEMGIDWLQTRCLTFLPFIFRWRGQVEQVRNILIRAQVIGATQNNSILAGHQAWVAWREDNLDEAETSGRRSVEEGQRQQMEFNPLQWVGLWPLIGVALARKKIASAINDVRLLLDPTQQPPPAELAAPLEEALQAWDAGEQEEARTYLQQAASLAQEKGYL